MNVKPFAGFLYSQRFKNEMSSIICPPYDIIDEKFQQELIKTHDLNYVRVVLSPHGNDEADKVLRSLIKNGIVCQDSNENIYILEQSFEHNGERGMTIGIIALVSLNAEILVHEQVQNKVVEDRMELLEKTGFNTCPIMTVSEKSDIMNWYKNLKDAEEIFSFSYLSTEFGIHVNGRLLRTQNFQILEELNKTRFFIADGHHRFRAIRNVYESNEEKYFMSYILDKNSGIKIFPIAREAPPEHKKTIIKKIEKFLIKDLPSDEINPFLFATMDYDAAILFPDRTLKVDFQLANLPGKNHLEIIHNYILDNIPFSFEHNMYKAFEKLKRGEIGCLIIPKSFTIEDIWELTKKGYIMPPKSTYFWPKPPSGLVLNKTSFHKP